MRSYNGYLKVLFFCMCAYASHSVHAEIGSFEELTVTISNKTGDIHPFQPIEFEITVKNNTQKGIIGHRLIKCDMRLELYLSKDNGKYKRFRSKHIMEKDTVGPATYVYNPSEAVKKSFLITGDFNKGRKEKKYLIDKPGIYKLKAVLNDLDFDDNNKTKSNVVTINVKKPDGIDAIAYSLLKQITNHAHIFYGPHIRDLKERKRVEKVLERIVYECGESSYAKYACKKLAGFYINDKSRPRSDAAELMKKALRNEKTWVEKSCLDFLVMYYCEQKNLKKAQMYSRKIEELFSDPNVMRSDEIKIYRLKREIENKEKN